MDIRILVGPIYAAACVGICVGLVSFARSEARQGWSARPFVWGAIIAIVLAFGASRVGFGPAELLSRTSFQSAIGLLALVAGSGALVFAFKARARASACYQARPHAVDDAVRRLRDGERVEGVFEGRASCDEPVTSPGGVVCVAYEASLRSPTVDGSRGALLGQERAHAHVLQLGGERASVSVALSPASLVAPAEIRRCRIGSTPSLLPTEVLASGALPTEALSYERVLRMGSRCRVVGRLERLPGGGYRIRGVAGLAPMVLVDDQVVDAGRRFFRSALLNFAASAVLLASGVFLLRG